jgi:hypothetical protein
MPNLIKYSTSAVTYTIKKGNIVLGVNNVDYGPTSTSGFYNGITPPISGYTFYINKPSGGPSIYVSTGDTQTIQLIQSLGGTGSTIENTLSWVASQSDIVVSNRDYENIVTSGMVLNLDAGFTGSYPKGNQQWYDISGSGNTGTLTNGPTFNSLSGGSIVFDGTNDSVVIPYSTSLQPTTAITMEAWVYLNSAPSSWYSVIQSPQQNGIHTPNYFDWAIYIKNDLGLHTRIDGVDAPIVQGSTTTKMMIQKWNQVAISWQNGVVYFFLNGQLIQTSYGAPSSITYDNNTNKLIGTNASGFEAFNGRISNVKLYGINLSPFGVYQNYNAQKSRFGIPDIVTSGLILNLDAGNPNSYNPLNTGSTTWTDVSGNGKNGTLTNGVYYSGGTMVFDGTNDYVETGVPILTSDASYTMVAWAKSSVSGFQNRLMGNADSTVGLSGTDIIWGANSVNKIYVVRRGGGSYDMISSDISNLLTAWHQITVTYDHTGVGSILYVDNIQVANNTGLGFNCSLPFRIGRDGNGNDRFQGNVSNVLLYNRALTESEVTQNYNALKDRYGL